MNNTSESIKYMETTKKCNTCLEHLEFDKFYRNKKGNKVLYAECKSCFSTRHRNYRLNNPEKIKDISRRYMSRNRPEKLMRMRQYYQDLRSELFNAYGNKCACCGETNKEFFAIDHINGGGNLEKRKYGTRPLFKKIKDAGYPKDKYQILCHNCNMSLGFYGYCPHNPSLRRPVAFGGRIVTNHESITAN